MRYHAIEAANSQSIQQLYRMYMIYQGGALFSEKIFHITVFNGNCTRDIYR